MPYGSVHPFAIETCIKAHILLFGAQISYFSLHKIYSALATLYSLSPFIAVPSRTQSYSEMPQGRRCSQATKQRFPIFRQSHNKLSRGERTDHP